VVRTADRGAEKMSTSRPTGSALSLLFSEPAI